MTMVDARTNDAKEISELIRNAYGGKIKVYDTEIPRSVRASEISKEGRHKACLSVISRLYH